MDQIKNQFSIEEQYQAYLRMVKLKEVTMSNVQRQQLKQSFFAAISQMLVLMGGPLPDLEEEAALATLKAMETECADFWLATRNRNN